MNITTTELPSTLQKGRTTLTISIKSEPFLNTAGGLYSLELNPMNDFSNSSQKGQYFTSTTKAEVAKYRLALLIAVLKELQLYNSQVRKSFFGFKKNTLDENGFIKALITKSTSLVDKRSMKDEINSMIKNRVNTPYINEITKNNRCFSTFNQSLINLLFSQTGGQNDQKVLKRLPVLIFDEQSQQMINDYCAMLKNNTLELLRRNCDN